jgi:phospholipase C
MKYPVISGCLAAAFAVVTATALANDGEREGNNRGGTATPIKHLVVIFQENISYDHYFGTYPNSMNLAGETPFKAKRHTLIFATP